MEKSQKDLRKRIYADAKITICTAVITGIVAVLQFWHYVILWRLRNIQEKIGEYYEQEASVDMALKRAVLCLFMCVVLILFSCILNEIHKTGRPFSQKIIKRMQTMAVLLMVAAVFPDMAVMVVKVVTSTNTAKMNLFDYENVIPMIFGVCMGLMSEIFKYGYEIQEDIDQIA